MTTSTDKLEKILKDYAHYHYDVMTNEPMQRGTPIREAKAALQSYIEQLVVEARIDELLKMRYEQETYSDDFRFDQAVSVKEIDRRLAELTNTKEKME